jgi:hypothetical protein
MCSLPRRGTLALLPRDATARTPTERDIQEGTSPASKEWLEMAVDAAEHQVRRRVRG